MAGCKFNPENELTRFNILENQQLGMLATAGIKDAAAIARKNALIIFNTITFPQNLASWLNSEVPRKDQIPAAWEVRDGQAYAEGFGTPDELWENTRIYNPEQFNEKERDAALLGFRLLINGQAKAVAYPMYDKNGIRYIPVLRRVGDTIVNESIDIGKVRDLTTVEGGDVLRWFNNAHEATSKLAHDDAEFPLLVLEKPPTVEKLRELALGRILLTEQNPQKALESIFDLPSQSSAPPGITEPKLDFVDAVKMGQNTHFDISVHHTIETAGKTPERIKKIDSRAIIEAVKPVANMAETLVVTGRKITQESIKTILSTSKFFYETRQQKQKKTKMEAEKARAGAPISDEISKRPIQIVSQIDKAKTRIEVWASHIKQQVKQQVEPLVQKTIEIFPKLFPTKKKKMVEEIRNPKPETRKTSWLKKITFNRNTQEKKLRDKPIMQQIQRQIREKIVKPVERIRHKTRKFLAGLKIKIIFIKKPDVATNQEFSYINSNQRQRVIIEYTLDKKALTRIRKIVSQSKLIKFVVFKVEQIKISFDKVRKIWQLNFQPEKVPWVLKKIIIPRIIGIGSQLNFRQCVGVKQFSRLRKLFSESRARFVRFYLSLVVTKHQLKRLKSIWNHPAFVIIPHPQTWTVSTKEKKAKLKRSPLQEGGWRLFWRWLIKAVSMRRENKIPHLNTKRINPAKKKLPQTGIIYSRSKQRNSSTYASSFLPR